MLRQSEKQISGFKLGASREMSNKKSPDKDKYRFNKNKSVVDFLLFAELISEQILEKGGRTLYRILRCWKWEEV